jgi:predicted nucleic acid-binding protein
METIIVDTNILLSALISNSKTREVIVNIDKQLVAPEAIYQEVNKYKDLIKDKAGISQEDLEKLLETMFKHIQIVSNEKIKESRDKAEKEISEVDEDDVIFQATALSAEGIIWSDDKDLQKQDLVETMTTEEIINQKYKE